METKLTAKDSDKKSVRIEIHLTPSVNDRVKLAAKKHGRTRKNFIEYILSEIN